MSGTETGTDNHMSSERANVRMKHRHIRILCFLLLPVLVASLWLVAGLLSDGRKAGAVPASGSEPSHARQALLPEPQETLHVVLDENYPPYSFRNGKGELQGLSIDLWRLYAQKTGTTVDLTGMAWSDAYHAMVDGHFDVIDTISYNGERAALLLFTEPYVTMNVTVFVRSELTGVSSFESLSGFRIGAKKSDNAIRRLEQLGLSVAREYPSAEALVLGAAAGEVDAFVSGEPSAKYYMFLHGLQRAFRVGETLYTGEFRRAVPINSPALLDQIQRGFGLISLRERENIQKHWYGSPLPAPVWVRNAMVAGGIAAGAMLLLAVWIVSLRRVVREKTKALSMLLDGEREHAEQLAIQNVTDGLTGLRNRLWYEKELLRLAAEPPVDFGVVMCDLDGLKLVNDTIGHAMGDRFLREASRCLIEAFPPQADISRIGGDEFLILCADTTTAGLEAARMKTGKLLRERFGLEYADLVSLSFGICWDAGPACDVPAMIREADLRMLRAKLHRHQSMRSDLVVMLRQMLKARDFVTQDHGRRSGRLCDRIGRRFGFHDGQLADLRLLATFHDIGKIGIPDAILMKPSPLTPDEYEVMKTHPSIGMRIAQSAVELQPIADFILKHHERWDGKGYPLGLAGESIPLQCRILAVVDAFDAMTNDRPYRAALPESEALLELSRCAGTQFDPQIVGMFHEAIAQADTEEPDTLSTMTWGHTRDE